MLLPFLLSVRSGLREPLHLTIGMTLFLAPLTAHAASLQEVQDWTETGFPPDVSMYAYVPDQVANDPPLLVLIHYCGGTASAVFGQAQGGGLIQAADQYGFVIVAPSSGRCWDVVSDQTRTRDGSGDSHAIRSMVTHAIAKYGVNVDRVYATGDSSGGMMTELLLGLYPDVFKAGSAMAGMPAACRGDNESGNGGGYSGACAGGTVSRTAEEWGAIVRSLAPDYAGLRPRVQMFHGDNDDIINYANLGEAVKEWTNVLGLGATPTSEQDVELGDHQATRQTWTADCGAIMVDAFTSHGGDHGPSDALFLSEYVIPFLGLDHVGPLDPYVAACDMAGTGGSGGQGAGGTGNGGSGGSSESAGGQGGSSGGSGGGAATAGGATSAGGTTTSGGAATMSGGTSSNGGGPTGAGATSSDPIGSAAAGCSFPLHRRRASDGLPWGLLLPTLSLLLLQRRRQRGASHSAASSR